VIMLFLNTVSSRFPLSAGCRRSRAGGPGQRRAPRTARSCFSSCARSSCRSLPAPRGTGTRQRSVASQTLIFCLLADKNFYTEGLAGNTPARWELPQPGGSRPALSDLAEPRHPEPSWPEARPSLGADAAEPPERAACLFSTASAAARWMQLYLNKILIQGIMHFASNQQLAVATLRLEGNHSNEASQGKALIRRCSISQPHPLPPQLPDRSLPLL